MNTRIAELARQAYIQDGIEKNPRYKPSEVTDMLLEDLDGTFQRFAMMIALECVQLIQNESMDSGDEFENGLRMAQDAIKQQFWLI